MDNTKCEICGNMCKKKIIKVGKDKGVSISVCPNCKLQFTKEMDFDFQLQGNSDLAVMESGFKHLRLTNFYKILSLMKEVIPSGAVGLEVGSLHGWFLDVANEAYVCNGIEPNNQMDIDKGSYTVYKGFFPQDLPPRTCNLDFIVFNDVFEHIPSCGNTMKECNKLLNGGVLNN